VFSHRQAVHTAPHASTRPTLVAGTMAPARRRCRRARSGHPSRRRSPAAHSPRRGWAVQLEIDTRRGCRERAAAARTEVVMSLPGSAFRCLARNVLADRRGPEPIRDDPPHALRPLYSRLSWLDRARHRLRPFCLAGIDEALQLLLQPGRATSSTSSEAAQARPAPRPPSRCAVARPDHARVGVNTDAHSGGGRPTSAHVALEVRRGSRSGSTCPLLAIRVATCSRANTS